MMQTQDNGLFSEITYLRDNPQSNSHLDAKGTPHDLTSFSDNICLGFNLKPRITLKQLFSPT